MTQSIEAIDSISQLASYPESPQKVVSVKGHHAPGDGGGGLFRYASSSSADEVAGMIIARTGRWIRIPDSADLSVKYFGARGDGTGDDTSAIQAAIDYAALPQREHGGMVYLPAGTYNVSGLTLRNRVRMRGDYRKTTLRALQPVPADPPTGLVEIEPGPVVGVVLTDLMLDGQDFDLTGIHVHAQAPDNTTDHGGGLWRAQFSNLGIYDFGRHGIHLRGGSHDDDPYYNYARPNQFLLFDNVEVTRPASVTSHALFIQGQAGQLNFRGCIFDGPSIDQDEPVGTNIRIYGPVNLPGTPAVLAFDTCTSQNARTAWHITGGQSIRLSTCWLENLDYAIHVDGKSQNIGIHGCRFANATDFGSEDKTNVAQDGQGALLKVEDGSFVVFAENLVGGTKDPADTDPTGNPYPDILFSISQDSTMIRRDNRPAFVASASTDE